MFFKGNDVLKQMALSVFKYLQYSRRYRALYATDIHFNGSGGIPTRVLTITTPGLRVRIGDAESFATHQRAPCADENSGGTLFSGDCP
jgi:hypothetical protein